MESLMAWRLVRPVIMAPNVRPDADGIEVIQQAVEVSAHRDHTCDTLLQLYLITQSRFMVIVVPLPGFLQHG